MILILTIGFEEKFQIRALMRRFNSLEKVVIVGLFSEEKAKKALESFLSVVEKSQVKYETIELDPHNFFDSISTLSKFILSHQGKDFVVNISGGMRILILEVLFSFILSGVNAEVEIETEDLSTLITFNIKDLTPVSLSSDHLSIMKAIKNNYTTANSIHNYLDMPVSTVWRRLKELKELGLVNEDNTLTRKGELMLKIYG